MHAPHLGEQGETSPTLCACLTASITPAADSLLAVDETSPAGAALAAKVFCNRALCHLRLKPPSFAAAAADASCALEVDPGYAKARLSWLPGVVGPAGWLLIFMAGRHCLSAGTPFSLCGFSPAIFRGGTWSCMTAAA